MNLELKMAQMNLREYNHLLTIHQDKIYRGWYRYEIDNDKEGIVYNNIFIRFRMPPSIPIYKGVVRTFSDEERLAGIHRMLIGRDLKDDAEKIKKFKTVNEYIETLNEDEVEELKSRFQKIVTFDCNKIPYLVIIDRATEKKDHSDQIKDFVASHPNYLDIFVKVLNNEISIQEATEKSKSIISNEFLELK